MGVSLGATDIGCRRERPANQRYIGVIGKCNLDEDSIDRGEQE